MFGASTRVAMNKHEKLAQARQRVAAITGFYIHVLVFAVVMALLLAINLAVSPIWWIQWPLAGWGVGILAHAFAVFGRTPRFIANWQLRKIREFRDQM
jgi:2TM domain-containing protein